MNLADLQLSVNELKSVTDKQWHDQILSFLVWTLVNIQERLDSLYISALISMYLDHYVAPSV